MRRALQPGGERVAARTHGDNTPQPIRSLRDWLDHLAARDWLVVVKPGTGLRFELAAVASVLTGCVQRCSRVRADILFPLSPASCPIAAGSRERWVSNRKRCWRDFKTPHSIPSRGGRQNWRRRRRSSIVRSILRNCFHCRPTTSTISGPYVTAGVTITRNPRTRVQNVAIRRLPIERAQSSRRALLPRHVHLLLRDGRSRAASDCRSRDRRRLRSCSHSCPPSPSHPIDVDELEIAGALHRRPSPW